MAKLKVIAKNSKDTLKYRSYIFSLEIINTGFVF